MARALGFSKVLRVIFQMEQSLKTSRLMNTVKEVQTKGSKLRVGGVGCVRGWSLRNLGNP